MKYSREEWHAHKFLTAKKELNVFKLVFLIFFELCQIPKQTILASGVRGNFSRGGFEKKIEHFVELFFRSTSLIFRALRKNSKDPVLRKFFSPQAVFFFLNKAKNDVLSTFKIAFFLRALRRLIYLHWRL